MKTGLDSLDSTTRCLWDPSLCPGLACLHFAEPTEGSTPPRHAQDSRPLTSQPPDVCDVEEDMGGDTAPLLSQMVPHIPSLPGSSVWTTWIGHAGH